jgi:hypothetical protein
MQFIAPFMMKNLNGFELGGNANALMCSFLPIHSLQSVSSKNDDNCFD